MDDFAKDFFKKSELPETPSSADVFLKKFLRGLPSASPDIYSFSGNGKNSVTLICDGIKGRVILATVSFFSKKNDEWEKCGVFLTKLTDRLNKEQVTAPNPTSHFKITGNEIAGGFYHYNIRQKGADNIYSQFATFLCEAKDKGRFKEAIDGAVGDFAYVLRGVRGNHHG